MSLLLLPGSHLLKTKAYVPLSALRSGQFAVGAKGELASGTVTLCVCFCVCRGRQGRVE